MLPDALEARLFAGHPWIYRDHVPERFHAEAGAFELGAGVVPGGWLRLVPKATGVTAEIPRVDEAPAPPDPVPAIAEFELFDLADTAVEQRDPLPLEAAAPTDPDVGAEPGVEVERWSFASEARALSDCEVGLMPLADDEWSRGKCACKALQYLSYARPVIASPVGVNRSLLSGKPYALLPENAPEWTQAIERCWRQRSELDALGREAQSLVRAEYSVDVWAERLCSLLAPVRPHSAATGSR